MTEPLDIQLRIRLAYEAGRNASRAKTDLQEIGAEARKLGQGVGAGELAKDLEKVARPAETTRQKIADAARAMQPAKREVADLQAHMQKMSGLRLGTALSDEVKALGLAARTTARQVRSIGTAAEKLGGVSLGTRYGNDLEALGRHADEARQKLERLNTAMHGTGRSGAGGGPNQPSHGSRPRRERGFEDDFVEGADLGAALKYGAIGYAAVGVQQQFWKHEAETTQRGAWDAVVNAPSDEEALRQGVRKFEVPADPEGETRKRMPNLARLKNGDFDKAPVAAKPPRTNLPTDARSSPRFQQPEQMRVDAGASTGVAGGTRQQVAMNDGPPSIQHFYGGFDEVAVARRSQLESNRQIRRSQARALHDLGRIA